VAVSDLPASAALQMNLASVASVLRDSGKQIPLFQVQDSLDWSTPGIFAGFPGIAEPATGCPPPQTPWMIPT